MGGTGEALDSSAEGDAATVYFANGETFHDAATRVRALDRALKIAPYMTVDGEYIYKRIVAAAIDFHAFLTGRPEVKKEVHVDE